MLGRRLSFTFFFFNDTATTEIYTLSLHDALPILKRHVLQDRHPRVVLERHIVELHFTGEVEFQDRKSTRLNSSHSQISYAVFCLKKKKKQHLVALYFVTPITTGR